MSFLCSLNASTPAKIGIAAGQPEPLRGRGFGKLMLDHLAEHARHHGVLLLRLETGVHQHEAIGLYERMGFRRVPRFHPTGRTR